jgi:hypothetical protein
MEHSAEQLRALASGMRARARKEPDEVMRQVLLAAAAAYDRAIVIVALAKDRDRTLH